MSIAALKVPTYFYAIDRFSDVVTKMTAKTSAFGATAQAAAMRTSRSFNSAGNKMLGAGIAIGTGLGFAANEAVKFEKRISNIGTLLPQLNPEQLKGLGDEILKISTKTSTPIDDLTSSFYDLISAGVGVGDSLKMIKSIDKLSIAGLGSLTEATDIQLAAQRNFKTSFNSSEEAANALFKTVKYGVTTVAKLSESFSANAGFAGDLGVKGQEFMAGIVGLTSTKMPTSQAEVGLGSLSNQIGKTTQKRNKILYGIFTKLGVTNGSDLVKKSGGFLPALTAISNTAKKAGINMQSIFPEKRASNAFLKLTNNTDAILAYNKSLDSLNNKSENALDIARKLQGQTASFKFGQVKNDLIALSITIGQAILPRLKEMADSVIGNARGIIQWAKDNSGLANTLMTVAKWLLILGVGAKILAFGFRTYAFYLKIATAATEAYTFVSSLAALQNVSFAFSLGRIIGLMGSATASFLASIAPIAAIVLALGGLIYMFNKSGNTVANFGKNNMIHLRTVSGEYESMEARIKASNDRIVAAMIKFKLDLASVARTGKTVAELAQERTSKIFNYANSKQSIGGIGTSISSTRIAIPKIKPIGTISDSDAAYQSITGNKPENLAGGKNYGKIGDGVGDRVGGIITINLNDPNDVVKSMDVKLPKGIHVVTTPNQGSRDKHN